MSFPDSNAYHDHTYYGNGCPNTWAEGGSTTACDIRIEKTFDGEDQYIGVYYNYQAATSGSGAAPSVNNSIVSDTFCPLGWQMPYSGTGGDYYDKSKSWKYVFDEYGITNTVAGNKKLRSYPLSYIVAGMYAWFSDGVILGVGSSSYYYSITISGPTDAYNLSFGVGGYTTPAGTKTGGESVRCAKFLASNHRRHGGRNTCRFNYI